MPTSRITSTLLAMWDRASTSQAPAVQHRPRMHRRPAQNQIPFVRLDDVDDSEECLDAVFYYEALDCASTIQATEAGHLNMTDRSQKERRHARARCNALSDRRARASSRSQRESKKLLHDELYPPRAGRQHGRRKQRRKTPKASRAAPLPPLPRRKAARIHQDELPAERYKRRWARGRHSFAAALVDCCTEATILEEQ